MKPQIEETIWNHELEEKVRKLWEKERVYRFNAKSKKKIFVIDTPPPYPSGRPWHIGAAAHYSQIDMIARTARMLGHETLFPIGIDRNGLPVEIYTEKKFDISINLTPREKFIEYCKTALDDLEAEMIKIMKTMGLSGDFENYYRTDSTEYRRLTQTTFIELWNRGLIYEDTRPNNYCTVCRTTIADAEVLYQELPTELVYVKFKVKETGEDLIIATTRPELLCSCQAVIVHPDDNRYKKLHGKTAILPMYNRTIPIIPNKEAKAEFGTGAVMICSYGDFHDVRLFRELKLEEIIAINIDGRFTHNSGKYSGMRVNEARRTIIEDLDKSGLVVKKEKILHRTPICERSKNPIEIIAMPEFYLKQLDYVKQMRMFAEALKFHPEVHRQLLIDWIDSVSIDWPISRRRVYATEIPVWYCKDCKRPQIPKPGKYYQPWKEKAPFNTCENCGGKEFVGEERTFDTWVDSSISPLFISKYKTDDKFFKKTYPNTLRPQSKDIVRTWLYYTLLRCYQLTGEMAWRHAWIMGYGVDERGEKMSKSKGNVIDPYPILEKYGADNFRFWNATEVSLGSDFRCSEQRIEAGSKFLTKFWNVARFISMFPQHKSAKLTNSDKWILGELGNLVESCNEGYRDFNFFIPSNKIREFTWNIFADHYLEMVKTRAYGQGFSKSEQKSVQFTLHLVLNTILKLLSPITPFMTDHIWRELYSKKSIHLEEFPEVKWDKKLNKLTKSILDFDSKVWNEKKYLKISLKDEIKMGIPKELEIFEKDLKAMHNIKP